MEITIDSLKRSALRRCQEYVKELLRSRSYKRPLWKQFMEAIGTRTDLDLTQKEEASRLIEDLINQAAKA